MIRHIPALLALTMVPACANSLPEPIANEAFVEARLEAIDQEQDASPEMMQTPDLEAFGSPPPRRVTRRVVRRTVTEAPATTIKQGAAAARVEPAAEGYVNAVQVYPYNEGALYRLYAGPGQVSDIALQAGETLVSVSAGDTVRWVVGDTLSGTGESARAHILVKPIKSGISTNLMIATDRRTYHLELESVDEGYMAALSWRYPKDEITALVKARRSAQFETAASGLSIDALNFDYEITGDKPDWRPVRVFDDGQKVFIQMPDRLSTTEAPPLFVIGETDGAELVNYRLKGKYYVVDRLFSRAELRLGTKRQTIVRIQKVKRGKRPAWLEAFTHG